MDTDRQRIFDFLVKESQSLGVAPVRDACDKFLRLGLKPAEGVEKRKSIPRQWVRDAWKRQGGRCSRCRQPVALDEATGDHTIAHSQGGEHSRRNTSAMCRPCNSSKGDNTTLEESRKTGRLMTDMFDDSGQEDKCLTP